MIWHIGASLKLRRKLIRDHPKTWIAILDRVDNRVWIGRFLFPNWWSESLALQHFCLFQIDRIPVRVLADDEVFTKIQKLRRGFAVWLYAILLGAAISSMS